MQCPTCDASYDGVNCYCGYERPASSGRIVFRSTEHPQPPGISSEEFGRALTNTISLIGGIQQLRRYRGLVAMGDLPKTDDYELRESKLKEQLRTSLVHLPADEVTEIVTRYPWVAAC